MSAVQKWGLEALQERHLFSLTLDSPKELPLPLELESTHFVCLVAWDATGIPTETVSAFVKSLLDAGAVYFVCWGPDCERVHDIVDEITSAPESGFPEDSCIMTTWHAQEPLPEALWFLLASASPDQYYDSTCRATLAISIGSDEWSDEIAEAMENPGGFMANVVQSDAT